MKILALEHELSGATPEQFDLHGRDEARLLWDLHQGGLVRELYFRADRPAAVLVLECASSDEASRLLARLPFVRQGLIAFDVIPLEPYPGFARLFDSAATDDKPS